MNKWKLYLDTSIISYLDQKDAPEKMQETRLFWDKVKAGAYDIVFSEVGLREINHCTKEKRTILLSYLKEIDYSRIDVNADVLRIARKIIELDILKKKNYDDCQHIGAAIISGCDAIISWNFKHIVNRKTMQGVKAITALEFRKKLFIYTPPIFMGDYEDDQ